MTQEKEAIAIMLNHYLSISIIIIGVISLIWLYALAYEWKSKTEIKLLSSISKNALGLGFLVSFIGMLVSLYYSDYLGILPCGLCWFQRVFLYSQVFIFGMALYKKDHKIFPYTLLLSTVGLIIAVYQSYLQMGYSELLPCPAIASTIDCAKPTFVEFGFVTFPLMSVVLFLFLMAVSLTAERKWSKVPANI